MDTESGRAPSGQALVSDQAASRLAPSGFDPSRITVDTVCDWTMRERAHYNGGKEWFGYGYQCVENPRLYRLDRYVRATRSVEAEWQVDGNKCRDLDDAVERLNEPVIATSAELDMLELLRLSFMTRSELKNADGYSAFDDPFGILHGLDRKGLIEWSNRAVRRTDAGNELLRPRDSDRNPEGEKPQALSAKHESAAPEGIARKDQS